MPNFNQQGLAQLSQMTPEDRIRQLKGMGAGDPAAQATSDTADFAAMHGQPGPGGEANYGLALADFLAKRGHKVNVNM